MRIINGFTIDLVFVLLLCVNLKHSVYNLIE